MSALLLAHSRPPAAKLQDPDAHVGEFVYVWGEVIRNDDALVIGAANGRFTVVGIDTTVEPGDSIQVYGTIRSDESIAAERAVVSEQSGLRGLYAISTAALVLTVGVFFRFWQIDFQRLAFTARREAVEDDA